MFPASLVLRVLKKKLSRVSLIIRPSFKILTSSALISTSPASPAPAEIVPTRVFSMVISPSLVIVIFPASPLSKVVVEMATSSTKFVPSNTVIPRILFTNSNIGIPPMIEIDFAPIFIDPEFPVPAVPVTKVLPLRLNS